MASSLPEFETSTVRPSPVEMERPPAVDSSGAREEKRSVARLAKRVGVALLAATLCYAGGLFHGWTRAQHDRSRLESQLAHALQDGELAESALQQAFERAQHARKDFEKRAALYEGFRQCQQALNALDERNFGIAESLLRRAEDSLGAIATSLPELSPVLAQLAQTHVEVARNLAAQRRQVAELVERLNTLIEGEREWRDAADSPAGRLPLDD